MSIRDLAAWYYYTVSIGRREREDDLDKSRFLKNRKTAGIDTTRYTPLDTGGFVVVADGPLVLKVPGDCTGADVVQLTANELKRVPIGGSKLLMICHPGDLFISIFQRSMPRWLKLGGTRGNESSC